VRLLLLSRYGGVWLDQDAWPLRSLLPLLRTNLQFVGAFEFPSAHTPIAHTNWHVLRIRRGSRLATRALHTLALYPYSDPSTWPRNSTSGLPIFGWNDGITGFMMSHNSAVDLDNHLAHVPMAWLDPADADCEPLVWASQARRNISDAAYFAALRHNPPFVYHSRYPKYAIPPDQPDSFIARLMRDLASNASRLSPRPVRRSNRVSSLSF
jgi:hypothetical protein